MTKEERYKLKGEYDDLTKIINVFKHEPYTRFCVTILDDNRKKYADVNIEDWDMHWDIMRVLMDRQRKLLTILNQEWPTID